MRQSRSLGGVACHLFPAILPPPCAPRRDDVLVVWAPFPSLLADDPGLHFVWDPGGEKLTMVMWKRLPHFEGRFHWCYSGPRRLRIRPEFQGHAPTRLG